MPNKQAPREPAPAMRREAPPAPSPKPRHRLLPRRKTPRPAPSLADPKSFEEVVALAEEKRDLKLKHALSEQVRLVRFRPGHLELNPLATAPKELGQELMRKLKAWTGRVWIVALSGEEGAAPLGFSAASARPARSSASAITPRSSRCWSISPMRASPRCGR